MAKKILKVALSPIGMVAGLLGGKKKVPAPIEGPKLMPLADDEKVKNARRVDVIRQRMRSGRASTILGGGETLGGY